MNGMKNDKLDALIMMSAHVLVEKNSDELLNADVSGVKRPKRLDRKIKRMIAKERRKREYGAWYPVLKSVAAAILIICSLTFALMMNVEAVRNAVWSTIIKWVGDYISIIHVNEEAPTTIETKMQPTVYPKEWKPEVAVETVGLYSIKYRYNDELIVSYHQWTLNQDVMRVDSKNASVTKVTIGKYEGELFTYSDDVSRILILSNGEYSFSLTTQSGNVSTEQLIHMAESVK